MSGHYIVAAGHLLRTSYPPEAAGAIESAAAVLAEVACKLGHMHM